MKDWIKHFVQSTDSTLRVIEKLNELSLPFVVVVDKAGRLLGTVTDGDIRRAILAGKDLSRYVSEVMNSSPFVVNANYDPAKVRRTCKAKGITFVPVVDDHGIITGVITYSEIEGNKKTDTPVVIMAGGLGSRLGELTKNCPKPMIKIGDKPILEILLNKLKHQAFRQIHLCVNYLHEQIQEYFEDGEEFGLEIDYVIENTRMGTAGALSLLRGKLDRPFIVTNADIITNINFNHMLDFFHAEKADAIVGVRNYEVEIPFGVIKSCNLKLISIDEKPRVPYLVSAGMYVITPKLIETLDSDTYLDMPDFLSKALERKSNVKIFPIHENWIDVGRTSDLLLASSQEIN